jgi:hypothetical protein
MSLIDAAEARWPIPRFSKACHQKRLKTYLGRVIRDIGRREPDDRRKPEFQFGLGGVPLARHWWLDARPCVATSPNVEAQKLVQPMLKHHPE